MVVVVVVFVVIINKRFIKYNNKINIYNNKIKIKKPNPFPQGPLQNAHRIRS